MKIVIDVDRLLHEGRITREEYERLNALAMKETGSLAFNILIGFGVVATVGGNLALFPWAAVALVQGLALSVAGIYITAYHAKDWGLLGRISLVVGSIMAAGGVIQMAEGRSLGFLVVAVVCAVGALLARSHLLAMLGVLALASAMGAMTGYSHATYTLVIHQPATTVGVFSLLALVAYQLSKRPSLDFQPLAITTARTSLFMVNLGFWVGSLWGDPLWLQNGRDVWDSRGDVILPDWFFIIGWAAALIATGVWAARANRRWVVNLVMVFGAIHFYTQYFERLGAYPGSIMFAGLLALALAAAIVRYNKAAVDAVDEGMNPHDRARPTTGPAMPAPGGEGAIERMAEVFGPAQIDPQIRPAHVDSTGRPRDL